LTKFELGGIITKLTRAEQFWSDKAKWYWAPTE